MKLKNILVTFPSSLYSDSQVCCCLVFGFEKKNKTLQSPIIPHLPGSASHLLSFLLL